MNVLGADSSLKLILVHLFCDEHDFKIWSLLQKLKHMGEFFSLLNFQYNLFLIALRDDYAGKKQCSELYQNKDT